MEQIRRFNSVESALRFYFRADEILTSKASLRIDPERPIYSSGENPREDLLLDFLSITSCLKELNSLQQWLLRELYQPRKFAERQRIVTRVCAQGRLRFPRVRWTLQGVGRLRHQTLDQVEPLMTQKGLLRDSRL
jgi:hypothetical protein